MKMIKGTIFVEGEYDMREIVSLLTRNDYTVQVKWVDGIDAFHMEYRIVYRREENDEP